MGTENTATMGTAKSDLILCYFTFDFIVYLIILEPLLKTNAIVQSNLMQFELFSFPSNQAFSQETMESTAYYCWFLYLLLVSVFASMNWPHLQGAVASSLCAVATAPTPRFCAVICCRHVVVV